MTRIRRSVGAALVLALLAPTACMVPEGTSTPASGAAGTTPVSVTGPGSPDQPLVMSFVASPGAPDRAAGASGLAELLAAEIGLTIQATEAESSAAIVRAIGAERTQIAWLDAFWYLSAREKHDAVPLLIAERRGSTVQAGQLVVGASSQIESLDGLVGRTFCRPSPDSAVGWVMPLLTLRAWGVEEMDLGRIVDEGSDDAVIRSVYDGSCDAGATSLGAEDALVGDLPDVKQKLRVLAATDAVPNDSASVPKGLPADLAEKLKNGLLAVSLTPDGADLLAAMFGADGLQPVEDSAYGALRGTVQRSGLALDQLLQEGGS